MMRKVVFFVLALIAMSSTAYSQDLKIGYANVDSIITKLPEFKVSQRSLETYAKQLQNQLTAQQTKAQTRYEQLQKDYPTMTDQAKAEAEKELQELDVKLRKLQLEAQQSLKKRENDLLMPLYDKATEAIKTVTKEQGYTYIMNTQTFFYKSEADDITDLVVAKLTQ